MMKKGQKYPSEKIALKDPATNATIWQMTNYPANHSNIYFTKTSFTPDEQKIVFLAQRNGWSNLYTACLETGEITQLTDYTEDVGLFSPCISPDGNFIYYTVANSIRRVSIPDLEDEIIVKFKGKYPGSLHLSYDGSFIVTRLYPGGPGIKSSVRRVIYDATHPLRKDGLPRLPQDARRFAWRSVTRLTSKKRYEIVTVRLDTRRVHTILETNRPGITLISPDNRHILYHMHERELWCVTIYGQHNRPLFRQYGNKWITHPNWLNEHEAIFIEWPHALRAISLDGDVRTVCELNVRHPSVNNTRTSIVCDTAHPDRGLYLIDVGSGVKRVICHTNSSAQHQWRRSKPPRFLPMVPSFIYDPFGSEWSHPHASFSPDGKKIIFNSDNGGGYSQIYIVFLNEQ